MTSPRRGTLGWVAAVVVATVVALSWAMTGPHQPVPKWLWWTALAWSEVVGATVVWVSLLGYRDPAANRATAWLFNAYRSLSADPNRDDLARERMLQNVWICGALVVLFAIVGIRELVK